jgi:hypothetical protein
MVKYLSLNFLKSIKMKNFIIKLAAIVALFIPEIAKAQCQFVSPTVELLNTQQDANGNCIVTFNLGFEIDVNNGNKIVFVHLWRTQDYIDFNYTNQGQPNETNVLANALATIIIDNNAVDLNPSAPANQVFLTSYGPDPGIDDNTGPAILQVKDASDGLTYTRVVVNAATNVYRYTVNNLSLVLPGACSSQLSFTGDAWSSNANNSNPAVQCSMEGFSFLANDPSIGSAFSCRPVGISNEYSYSVSTNSAHTVQFNTDVYVDNGDDFFESTLDIPVLSNAGPFTITSGSPYNSGNLTYPAPYSTTAPYRTRNLWVVVKNMTVTNNTVAPPTVTSLSNLLLERVFNTCGAVALPISIIDFSGYRKAEQVILKWTVAETSDMGRFIVQRQTGNSGWQDIATIERNDNNKTVFEYVDNNRFSDNSFYRIKAISNSDEAGYTKQILIQGIAGTTTNASIVPNPATNGRLSLNIAAVEGVTTVKVFNLVGQLVRSQTIDKDGTYSFDKLAAGSYFVSLVKDNASIIYVGKAVILE